MYGVDLASFCREWEEYEILPITWRQLDDGAKLLDFHIAASLPHGSRWKIDWLAGALSRQLDRGLTECLLDACAFLGAIGDIGKKVEIQIGNADGCWLHGRSISPYDPAPLIAIP